MEFCKLNLFTANYLSCILLSYGVEKG